MNKFLKICFVIGLFIIAIVLYVKFSDDNPKKQVKNAVNISLLGTQIYVNAKSNDLAIYYLYKGPYTETVINQTIEKITTTELIKSHELNNNCKPQTQYACFVVLLSDKESYQRIVESNIALRKFNRMPLKERNKLYTSGKYPQSPVNEDRFKKVYLADARIYYKDFTMTYKTQIRSPDIKNN